MYRKLTEKEVREIRESQRVQYTRRGKGKKLPNSLRQLAIRYGVTHRNILSVIKGQTWKQVQ